MGWLKDYLNPTVNIIKPIEIIEVEQPRHIDLADSIESLEALSHHPGFTALMARLRLSRAQLQSRLATNLGATLDEVRFLQAGIYWSGWLETQIKSLVYKTKPKVSTPSEQEQAIFEEIHQSLELVGQ